MLMFCISIGIGRTLLTISSMYYGAADRNGLRRVFAYAIKLVVAVTLGVGAVLFFTAPLLSRIYTNDPEVISLSVFSIRCMAVGLALDGISEVYQDYLQGVQNRKMVNILCFAERFFIPVGTAFLLGMAFGTKGIMASIAVGKLILFLLMFLYLSVRNRSVPKKTEDFMLLAEGFGGREEDNLTAQIHTMEDVVRESERAAEFCLRHGMDRRQSFLLALFVEEMGGNIVRHGKPRGRGGLCVDYRLFVNEGKASMSLRDYCDYDIHNKGNAEDSFGIRLVMKLAKDIRYINTFNSNCLFINLEVKNAHETGTGSRHYFPKGQDRCRYSKMQK
jgi:hypothetical protein